MNEPVKSAIDQLLDQWDTDSAWDKTEPSQAMNKIPQLHAKYARIMSTHVRKSKQVDYVLTTTRKFKTDYFKGRLTREELEKHNLPQFKLTIIREDLDNHINADPEIMALVMKRAVHDEIVRICESILKELHSRTYQIKTYCDWERFMAGA